MPCPNCEHKTLCIVFTGDADERLGYAGSMGSRHKKKFPGVVGW